MFVAIGDTYAGLLENTLKNTNESDSVFVLEEAFKSLFQITQEAGVSAQCGAAITISKIIHASPSAYFHKLFEMIISNIIAYLKPDHCKSPFEVGICLKGLGYCKKTLIEFFLLDYSFFADFGVWCVFDSL